MNFNLDFLKYFGEVGIVHLDPRDTGLDAKDNAANFDIFKMDGKWSRDPDIGGINGSLGRAFVKIVQHLS